jgi:hypothetical protein
MKLLEFFSKSIDIASNQKDRYQNSNIKKDDLFWYIIDHDKLHKDFFFPIAKKIKSLKECDSTMVLELFMPMVKKGCKEYYVHKKMEGKLGKLFPKDLREEICHRLYDHFKDDIQKNKYNLGM